MRIAKRIGTTGLAAVTVAAGLILGGAGTAVAAVNPTTFIPGPGASHLGCDVTLFSTHPSASTPADVFAAVDSNHPGRTCVAFVERSGTSTTNWAVVSGKVGLPSASGLNGLAATGLINDGPGYKARACVQASGTTTVTCTSAVSLAKGSGTATSSALSPVWQRKMADVTRAPSGSGAPGVCVGILTSTTTTKTSSSNVMAVVESATDPCLGWVQISPDGGKSWDTRSPIVSLQGPALPNLGVVFTQSYQDHPGQIARICVKDVTTKKLNCSGTW